MYNNLIFFVLSVFFACMSCNEEFLEEEPVGEVSPELMKSKENIEKVIVAAYSVLNGQMDGASNAFNAPASNWSFGDVMSDDAYKGGGGTGDQNQIHRMEIYNAEPTITDINRKWQALYEGVQRTNTALGLLQSTRDYEEDLRNQRIAEMRFLRGHFYFELKKIYQKIPFIDETAEGLNDYLVSNVALSSNELWNKIEADFEAAFEKLPLTQREPGRATKMAAKAYLAKCYIFQREWQAAYDATSEVIQSNRYELMPDFRELFLPENDNGQEVIFAVQHSVNDGTPNNYSGSIGDRLAPPGGPYYPQYGFHRPSQDLVNAFKTTLDGLPAPETSDLSIDDNVDPRLDHTVGRPGIPYLDLGIIYEESWAREAGVYGPYGPKKRIVSANSEYHVASWPYVNALNYYVIRYADVLLWHAEAAVELNKLNEARSMVNRIRNRAKNTQVVTKLNSSEPAANYSVEPYTEAWVDKNIAREAVRTETRLEFALEGKRFFNLSRWGIAAEVINEYLQEEKTVRTFLANANFEKGKHEVFPIPQSYIDAASENVVVEQNNGY